MEDEDIDYHTSALTIEIDTDDLEDEENTVNEETIDDTSTVLPKIGAPVSIQQALLKPGDNVLVGNVPDKMRTVLSEHLNLISVGSLLNWESIASKMGLTNDTIMTLRNKNDPTRMMLQQLRNTPLNNLLDAIVYCHRVDTLVSVRKYIREMMSNGKMWIDNNVVNQMEEHEHDFHSASTSRVESVYGSSLLPKYLTDAGTKFLLVTHYEDTDNDRKTFKWLMKNLKVHAKGCDSVQIIDVDSLQLEENWTRQLISAFEKAHHIVVCITSAYKRVLNESHAEAENNVKIRQTLHNLMDSEFVKHGASNKRFRPVMMEGSSSQDVPSGWPSATIRYSFPGGAKELFQRLFEQKHKPDPLTTL